MTESSWYSFSYNGFRASFIVKYRKNSLFLVNCVIEKCSHVCIYNLGQKILRLSRK